MRVLLGLNLRAPSRVCRPPFKGFFKGEGSFKGGGLGASRRPRTMMSNNSIHYNYNNSSSSPNSNISSNSSTRHTSSNSNNRNNNNNTNNRNNRMNRNKGNNRHSRNDWKIKVIAKTEII